MNMVDMYLKMNSCERDRDNNIYFVDPMDNSKRDLIGMLKEVDIKNGVLNITYKADSPISFIRVRVRMEK
jgi:hypothetical protein